MKNVIFLIISFIFINQIFAKPVIISFNPASGPIGTTVIIKGTGFSTTAANNIVYFGAVKAAITNATDSTLTVTVPVGATYQPITVTTNKLTAYSANSFIVTFSGDNNLFTSNSFLPKKDITTGIYPHSISIADFNNDGKTDLLVLKGSSGTVSVFKNTSSNTGISFGTKLEIAAAGNNHEAAATGDLDGDGRTDFVITNTFGNSSVSVFRNTSAGDNISFAPKVDYPVNNNPYSVAIGDLNGDGKPDMASVNSGSTSVSVYINTSTPGTISFKTKIDFATGTSPYCVAINDLDGDGKGDLAITTQGQSSSLSVMKNTTAGDTLSFDVPVDYVTVRGLFTVSISDLDGDQKPDLTAASAFSNSVIILRNTSTSGNLSFGSQLNVAAGNYPVCVSISDLDGDGKPDLITSNRSQNTVSAVKNTSSEGNLSFSSPVDYAVGADPFYAAVGDLDGDSRPDIVVANSSDDAVSILRNIISANISPVITSFTPASGNAGTTVKITGSNFSDATSIKFGGVEAASFKVDSATHITAVVGAGASGDVSVTAANGTAALSGFRFDGPVITSFTPMIGITGTIVTISGSNFTNVTDVKFGETSAVTFTVNSPTTITATVASGSSGDVMVITSNGKAILPGFTFGVPTITSFSPASGPAGSTVTIKGSNFNKTTSGNIVFFGAVKAKVSSASSTQLEVVVPAGATYQPISVTTNRLTAYSAQSFILTFTGDTTRLSSHSFSVSGNFATGTYPSTVYISDLNEDNKPDLVTVNAVGNSISILKNTSTEGKISFNAKMDYNTGTNPSKIAIGDLDGDGKPDMVVTNFNSGNVSTISVFINNSSGETISFGAKTDLPTGNGSIGAAIDDMNGDGKPDIVVSSGNSGIFSVFENTTLSSGSVSFSVKKDFTLYGHADNITIADLDKDGKPDVITSNFSDGTISIFRNISVGGQLSFAEKNDYPAGINPGYITTGDLDGDGKADVIVTNYTSKTVAFFKNYSNIGSISLGVMQEYKIGAKNIDIADLNGDGKLDLCAGTYNTGIVSVMQNTFPGNENFSFGPQNDFTTGNYDTYVSIGDIDGDGKPEVAVANTIANSVSILKANTDSNGLVITSSSVISGGKGTTVKLYGSNFTGVTSVVFGGTPAASFTIVSATEIDAVVGEGASGDITVATPSKSAELTGFKFIPHISINGAVTLCKDDSVILTSSAAEHNQWLKDGTLIRGAADRTLVVQASGSYSVQVTANNISTSSDNNIAVTITLVPTPSITKDTDNNLASSSATGNQWFLNGNTISGANNQKYHPDKSGDYTVKDTINGCTSELSAPFNIKLTGIDLGNGQYISAYPNPVKNNLNINWDITDVLLLNAEVTDMQGKKWMSVTNLSNSASIDLSKLHGGIYFIRIFDNQHKIDNTIKIIKEK